MGFRSNFQSGEFRWCGELIPVGFQTNFRGGEFKWCGEPITVGYQTNFQDGEWVSSCREPIDRFATVSSYVMHGFLMCTMFCF